LIHHNLIGEFSIGEGLSPMEMAELFITNEEPVGVVDGFNAVYTPNNTFAAKSTAVYLNGQRMTRDVDYTEVLIPDADPLLDMVKGSSITFVQAPDYGDEVLIDYVKFV